MADRTTPPSEPRPTQVAPTEPVPSELASNGLASSGLASSGSTSVEEATASDGAGFATPGAGTLEQRLEELALRQLEMHDMESFGAPRGEPLALDVAWRDHGDAGRIERVWGHLEGSLRAGRRREQRRPVVALCAAAAVFGLGVLVGRTSLEDPAPSAEVATRGILTPEPYIAEESHLAPERLDRPSAASPAAGTRRVGPRRPAPIRRSAPVATVQPEREEAPSEVEFPSVGPAPEVQVPRWLLLVDRGEYTAAFQAVDEAGGFDAVLAKASAEELMTLADVARAAGQQGRAIQALRRVVQLHADDPNAPVAAMMLGNLLYRAGDAVGAAEAYALNRSLSPQGDFAEDALAREFEVALEAADVERARALATQYEREFPQGRRLGDIQEQLSRAQQERDAHARDGFAREPRSRDGHSSADHPSTDPAPTGRSEDGARDGADPDRDVPAQRDDETEALD